MTTSDEIRAALERAGHHGPDFPTPDQIERVARELHVHPGYVVQAFAGTDRAHLDEQTIGEVARLIGTSTDTVRQAARRPAGLPPTGTSALERLLPPDLDKLPEDRP